MSLHDVHYSTGAMNFTQRRRVEPEENLRRYIDEARRIVEETGARSGNDRSDKEIELSEDFEHLRWFPLPYEVVEVSPRD